MNDSLVTLLFALTALYLIFWIAVSVPAGMARARGRSAVVWVLISLILSPLVAIFLLWLLGRS